MPRGLRATYRAALVRDGTFLPLEPLIKGRAIRSWLRLLYRSSGSLANVVPFGAVRAAR